MIKKVIAVVAVCCALSAPAYATTAGELFAMAAKGGTYTSTGDSGFYQGYINAVINDYTYQLCSPANERVQDSYGKIYNYIQQHPNRMGDTASNVIREALASIYACK